LESIGVEFSDFHSGNIVVLLDVHPLEVVLPLEPSDVVFAIDNLLLLIDHLECFCILTPLFLGLAHDRSEKSSIGGFLLESSHHALPVVIFEKIEILEGTLRKHVLVGSDEVCIVFEIHEGVDKLVVLEIVYIPFLGEALDDVQASHDLHLFLLWLHILHFNSGLNLLELRSKTVE